MHDIFVSYARSTEPQAHLITESLRELGYSVWRDDQLPAHRAFTEVLEERLRDARAVVVLWSSDALRSEWVQSEADRARAARKLVQASLDGSLPPMPFDRIQCADLNAWTGDPQAPGWRKVVESLDELVGVAAPRPLPLAPSPGGEPLLAVLPFDNLSGDPEMIYFSDGVSEEVQQAVARGAALKVIGRTSSFQFRGAAKTVRRVMSELGATHILDGSVRRSGSRVRVSAQLIRCAGEVSLWSERFDRELTDIFELQDEIAAAVAGALESTFASPPQRPPVPTAAFDLYLRARSKVLNMEIAAQPGGEDAREAVALYEQAVALAPDFAAAWAGLANARAVVILHGVREQPYAEMRSGVVDAVEQALRLHPRDGMAYAALAMLEPPAAHQARKTLLLRALGCEPDNPEILHRYAHHLFQTGQLRASMVQTRRALALDPLLPTALHGYATVLASVEGRYEESQAIFAEGRKRWPADHGFIITSLNQAAWREDWKGFERQAEAIESAPQPDPRLQRVLKFRRGVPRRDPALVASLERGLAGQLARSGSVRLETAIAACALGLLDETFGAIDKSSYAYMLEPDGPQPAAGWNPGIIFMPDGNAAMMRDPRFVGLCAKLGLCDYWIETGEWPDCADEVPYDFRAEARRLSRTGAGSPPKV